ncbi:HK97 family phage prohead protease [Aureimonas glaciei]|uniref:Peptidase U35 n=1 Tax=Aureimonas glaciei TaxID=1776957 RepID=A0A916YF23_9HYPH|nr:HK97 family phage prohead protease [Aureimonas glaciei]GGD42589.1 peptidase U35 [Aureimonas glaciei]
MDHLDLQFRFSATDDTGIFTGYAAIYAEMNSHGETIKPGAFRKTLAEHKRSGTRPVMLWSHNPSEIIGVWDEIEEDAKGLRVKGRIIRETARGAETYALIKAGAVNGLSMGFRARSATRSADGGRVLTDIELVEISVVGLPSAAKARIKSLNSLRSGRSLSAAAFVEACRKATRSLEKRK